MPVINEELFEHRPEDGPVEGTMCPTAHVLQVDRTGPVPRNGLQLGRGGQSQTWGGCQQVCDRGGREVAEGRWEQEAILEAAGEGHCL